MALTDPLIIFKIDPKATNSMAPINNPPRTEEYLPDGKFEWKPLISSSNGWVELPLGNLKGNLEKIIIIADEGPILLRVGLISGSFEIPITKLYVWDLPVSFLSKLRDLHIKNENTTTDIQVEVRLYSRLENI